MAFVLKCFEMDDSASFIPAFFFQSLCKAKRERSMIVETYVITY